MKLVRRDPEKGYVDHMLWIPKHLVNAEGVKRALEFELSDRNTIRCLRLWRESEHHLVVPRAFWKTEELPFECIDCRPAFYEKTQVTSRIHLDHKPGPGGLLQPTGKRLQQNAIETLLVSTGGTLQLACVAGDTELQISRAGAGRRITIADACRKYNGGSTSGKIWDSRIPTYIRSFQGDRIGLQRVSAIIYKGKRKTYQLSLADGKKLRVTKDHEVLTRRGFLSLKSGLTAGDYITVDSGQAKWGKKKESSRKSKPVYKRLNWYTSHPYAYKNGTKNGPRTGRKQTYTLEEHRAVAEARLNQLSLAQYRERCRTGDVAGLTFIDPSKYHVHHIDENHKNNAPDNLEVLPVEEHLAGHRPGAAAFGYGKPTSVRLVSVIDYGIEDVYDVVCEDPHRNFVANGIVVHNCGKGKTVVALHFAALLQVPTLIAVDNTHLLHQWQEEIARHLDVPGGVGLIQGSIKDWDKDIVMATYHTLANWAETMPEEVRRKFGLVIWDEGHHVSAPVFSKSAPLFYGYRLALSATPSRSDGSQVVCQYHVGDVIFKDVVQDHPPKVVFKWTGFTLNMEESATRVDVCAKNGELHLGKLAGYFGANRERLTTVVLPEVRRLVQLGHKVLVLSYSVDEVVNLMTLWTDNDPNTMLYTDIPYPTAADVGEELDPMELKPAYVAKITRTIKDIEGNLRRNKNSIGKDNMRLYQERLELYRGQLGQFEVWKKTEKELRRRQRDFIRDLLAKPSTSGLFTEIVDPQTRLDMLAKRQVIFAIMKYGKEGLDDKKLSAIVACEPMSDRNTLQQIMGRPRDKKNSELVFLEDNIHPLIAQCIKLRRHLRNWAPEEGGPFRYTQVDHPSLKRRAGTTGIRVPVTGGSNGT